MNNDKFEQNEINIESHILKAQEFPGGFRTPPQQGGRPPSSPPPGFVPETPRMSEQPFSGAPDSRSQYRGGGQNQYSSFTRCLNRFTYIWLVNGNNFWFYPTFIGWGQVSGFRWRRGRWEYDRINIRRILFHRCF